MRYAAAAAAGALATWAIITLTNTAQVEYRTDVIRYTQDTVTTIDLEELRDQISDLDQQLAHECLLMIHRKTGDPEQGIRNHVDRHYDGDACRAAEEAMRGDW